MQYNENDNKNRDMLRYISACLEAEEIFEEFGNNLDKRLESVINQQKDGWLETIKKLQKLETENEEIKEALNKVVEVFRNYD